MPPGVFSGLLLVHIGCLGSAVQLSSLSEQCRQWKATLEAVQQARAKERREMERAISAKVVLIRDQLADLLQCFLFNTCESGPSHIQNLNF